MEIWFHGGGGSSPSPGKFFFACYTLEGRKESFYFIHRQAGKLSHERGKLTERCFLFIYLVVVCAQGWLTCILWQNNHDPHVD